MNQRLLFICKERKYGSSYGLINSCKFITNFLHKKGIEAKVISVVDNNCIDKEVSEYKPTIVFIEALWVVPDKFRILCKLHPNIKWVVRLHSKAPFLSSEGIAMSWLNEYLLLKEEGLNVEVSVNNKEFYGDLISSKSENISYLPNIYDVDYEIKEHSKCKETVSIGCFGAHRLLKNQFEQAIAAIVFANKIGKKLIFHMNFSNIEKEEAILRNIKALFEYTEHELVLHKWMPHEEFVQFIATLDLGLQCSFSESFNIVSSDFVYANTPIIVSQDVSWMPFFSKASPSNTTEIVNKLLLAYKLPFLKCFNKKALKNYNNQAKLTWINYLNNG